MDIISSLVYVSDVDPGIYRKRWGRGFQYLDEHGKKISGKDIIDRINELRIPPMWDDVWICKLPNGHIQATGKDVKRRKQYMYHPEWSKYRNSNKFKRMAQFARALPQIRKKSEEHLKLKQWTKEKVLGLVVQLLNGFYIRIGNNYYKEQNNTYGLTTLRRKHLMVEGKRLTFHYKAKSGKMKEVNVIDKQLVKLIKECSELPGHEIFRYVDEDGKYQCIDSYDVNQYIRLLSDGEFSSKDFRTWGGTVLAVDKLEEAIKELENNPRLELIPTVVGKVAEVLGNTKAICKDYYIHPSVLKIIEEDSLTQYSKGLYRKYRKLFKELAPNELIALNIIESAELVPED